MPTPMPGGQWMRRVWERVGSIQAGFAPVPRDQAAVDAAEQALREAPDSRDRHRDLVFALSRAGNLERGLEVAELWVSRDQLDPEALIALADILSRMGRRDEGTRILSGVVDLEPDSRPLHERLVDAFDRAGMTARACTHRVAIAEANDEDSTAAGSALRCERALGENDLAAQLLAGLDDASARQRAEQAASVPPRSQEVRGDMMVDATWGSADDLDVSIIGSDGRRISWMGGHRNVVGDSARVPGRERLGLRWTPAGSYVIEISRADPSSTMPVSGVLQLRILDSRQAVPFTLAADRVQVARLSVRRESRLVPAW